MDVLREDDRRRMDEIAESPRRHRDLRTHQLATRVDPGAACRKSLAWVGDAAAAASSPAPEKGRQAAKGGARPPHGAGRNSGLSEVRPPSGTRDPSASGAETSTVTPAAAAAVATAGASAAAATAS